MFHFERRPRCLSNGYVGAGVRCRQACSVHHEKPPAKTAAAGKVWTPPRTSDG